MNKEKTQSRKYVDIVLNKTFTSNVIMKSIAYLKLVYKVVLYNAYYRPCLKSAFHSTYCLT